MFKKLHYQLIFFCGLVIGIVLLVMTCICLYISESHIRRQSYADFQNNASSILIHLNEQTSISHTWLSQVEYSGHLSIYILDNGIPLLYDNLKRSEEEDILYQTACEMAKNTFGLDITASKHSSALSRHEEFTLCSARGVEYYASAAVIPKNEGCLGIMLLHSTEWEQTRILQERFLFGLGSVISLVFLIIPAYFFIGRMLRPIEASRQRQIQFVASASHELRSPLAVMLSSLSAMRMAKGEDADKFAENIESEGRRMSRLIDDMLLLASSDSQNWTIHPEAVELDTLLLQTFEKYEALASKKNLHLQILLPEEPIEPYPCDRERMEQLLSILIDNALSYTPKGGKIQLSLSCSESGCRLCVADNGPGIAPSRKQEVFERFYRADSSRNEKSHFGLGLCIAKEIVKLHHGKIWIADTPGGGATFIVHLPPSLTAGYIHRQFLPDI